MSFIEVRIYIVRCSWCGRREDGGADCTSESEVWDVALRRGWTEERTSDDRTLHLCKPCSERFTLLGAWHENGGIDPAHGTALTLTETP